MNKPYLYLCGIIAPFIFVFTVILGGAIRPGYSHLSDTMSELFSPGSPNKLLLDSLHTAYAIFLILFGVGVLHFVKDRGDSSWIGRIGASLFTAMGVVSVSTATIFPQDAWGSPPTFPGRMHILLHGMIGILSIGAILLLGTWFRQTKIFPWFRTYSYITIIVVVFLTGMFSAAAGGPFMGLVERILGLAGFQWTITLAVQLLIADRKLSGL